MILASELSTPQTGVFGNFANTFIAALFRYGLPRRIDICNSITGSLLEELCDILKIELGYEDNLPAIKEAEESLLRFMG